MPCSGCQRRKRKLKNWIARIAARFVPQEEESMAFGFANLAKLARVKKADPAATAAKLTAEDKQRLKTLYARLQGSSREHFRKGFGEHGKFLDE